jgi:cysteine-rich repeat protein
VSACVGSGDSVAIDIPASGTVALTTFSSRTQSFVVDDAAYLTNISPALTLTGTSCVLAAVHEDPSLAHPLAYSQQALCSFNGGTAGGFTFPNTPLVAGHTYILQLMVITGTVQVEVSQSDPYPAGGSDLGASNDVVMTVRTANLRSCACGNGNVDLSTSARYPDEQCDDANIAAGDGCDADCQVE